MKLSFKLIFVILFSSFLSCNKTKKESLKPESKTSNALMSVQPFAENVFS